MARGRKPKATTEVVKVDHAKLLKQNEQEQQIQLEKLYKDLAKIKHLVDTGLTHVGLMDNCDTLGEAAFKAGRAFNLLDDANDKLEEILDDMYNFNYDNLDHWNDIINEN